MENDSDFCGRDLRLECEFWPLSGTVPFPDFSSFAHSARTALLAPLLVSSALCMLSIFQSGRKRWADLHSWCQLSSGLSEVLCQIPLLASPAGSEEINQKERLRRGDTLYAATLLLFHKRRTLWSLPVVISLREYDGSRNETGFVFFNSFLFFWGVLQNELEPFS